MTPHEFRARAAGLLEELEATDVGQVATLVLEWIREQLAAEGVVEERFDGGDQWAYQRACDGPGCDRGLLLAPARWCARCGGSGFLVRWVNKEAEEIDDQASGSARGDTLRTR